MQAAPGTEDESSDSGVFARANGCAHCNTEVGDRTARDADGNLFCCRGCRTVYAMIRACKLEGYYQELGKLDRPPEPARTTAESYEEFDHPDFQSAYVRSEADGLCSVQLTLEGIHCAACVWLIEKLPRVAPGVLEARLEYGRARVRVRYRPDQIRVSQIARALDSLGYSPHASASSGGDAELKADRALLLRLGVAGAAAGNVMLMALALYCGAVDNSEAAYGSLFRFGSLALTLPTVAFSGGVFFKGAWAALRTRTPHMDLPVSVGILAGTIWGTRSTLLGRGEVYFDTIAILIFLLLIGRWLGRQQQRRAARATELFAALAPQNARVVEGQELRTVPAASVRQGATVEVAPGERIPVDGVVISGLSSVDASTLSGEARPETVEIGDRVFAGTVNLEANLRIRTESAGAATRVGRLMSSVEEAQASRPPIVRTADRVAGWLVWATLGLALLTVLIWLRLDPSHAVDHAVALLVVTCPCALGMATPLSVSAALSRAASAGLLFKRGEFLEELARPALVVLDKTGTLTEGRPELWSFDGPETSRALIRAAESTSEHPVARALQRGLAGVPELSPSEVRAIAGGGVVASVSGHRVIVGSPALVKKELGLAEFERSMSAVIEGHAAAGRTPIVAAIDGEPVALLSVSDSLRGDAKASLLRLKSLGYELMVLSGDHPAVVESTAELLGVRWLAVEGGVSPEQKLSRIQELRRQYGRVVMVGDGVNDAAALSAATCGFAVHGGAEASLIAADIFATETGLAPLVRAIEGSRRTLRTIQRGIAFSLVYNLIGVGLAVTGALTPLWAAVLMPLSSLTVVSNALKSRSFLH